MSFTSFRTRILVFFLGLLALVQVVAFVLVTSANRRSARQEIDRALETTAGVFSRLIDARTRELLQAARLLSADFAFKQAYAADDGPTLDSALENHRLRIGADLMALVSLENRLLSDTLGLTEKQPSPFGGLIDAAMATDRGEHAALLALERREYQVVVVPLLAPAPVGFIVVGFLVGDDLVGEMRSLTACEVTLASPGAEVFDVWASTMPRAGWPALREELARRRWSARQSTSFRLNGEDYVSLVAPLAVSGEPPVFAVLQRSLSVAMEPHKRLRLVLYGVLGVGLVLSSLGGRILAGTVTKPVLALAEGARRIEAGDYTARVNLDQADEIGWLAACFNRMGRGLAERDRVRSLLGKVVSPAIADELLSRKIELGGEECVVTILFSDLRGFTPMCEKRPAHEVVALLNAHLTRQTDAVEAHGGVVNQYVGDAIMALFGAPLRHADDPKRAVQAALDMVAALEEWNAERAAEGEAPLGLGVGINTGPVIAGNMGSLNRLTYTVVGDGVPLAARLESLTKTYKTPVIVGETTRALVDDFAFVELDRVVVKGRAQPTTIYAPLGRQEVLTATQLAEVDAYHQALADYRARAWDAAAAGFAALKGSVACRHAALYLARIDRFRSSPPAADWRGIHTFEHK